jgi:hypothetical protein
MRIRILAAIGLVAGAACATAYLSQSTVESFDEDASGPWSKPVTGDFWAHRVSYPTMNFSPAWYTEAKPADRAISAGVPAGEKSYLRSAESPLTLAPNGWTFLGPSP